MTTFGAVLVSRNDNYGGFLKERASYALNSCIETYDEIVYVDWNSRGISLIEEIEPNIIKSGKLRCVIVTPEQHKIFTNYFEKSQPCSEVLGRNVGLRRLNTDYLVSTNIDEINPYRKYLEDFATPDTMITVARRGTNLGMVSDIGNYFEVDKIRRILQKIDLPQSYAVTREPYSKIEWCGDFQMAHRDVWYAVRGYSEFQLGIGFHDSYIQRRVEEAGFKVIPNYDIPLFHLDHHKGNDYGEHGKLNDPECLSPNFKAEDNPLCWGHDGYKFREFYL